MQNPDTVRQMAENHILSSQADGRHTVLLFQEASGVRYIDRACFIAIEEDAATECP